MNPNSSAIPESPEIDHGLELSEGEIITLETIEELSDGKGDEEDE